MVCFAACGGNYSTQVKADFIKLDITETDIPTNYTFQSFSDFQNNIGGDVTKFNFADFNYVFF